MRVSIIIPNFNGAQLLSDNLPFIKEAMKNSKNKILEVIVVDDGSTDNSIEVLKGYDWVKIIKHKVNRGFSSTVNTGVRGSKGSLIALLNTDVRPMTNFLESAIKHFDDKRVFGVSLHEKGYGWSKGKFRDGFIVHEPGSETKSFHQSFWASGGSAIFNKETWTDLGGLDERLFSPFYWEDVDISYRAQKRGFTVLWDPEAMVLHNHESTISKLKRKHVSRIQERNHLIFIWKNLTSTRLFRKHILALLRRTLNHPGYIRIVLMAMLRLPKIISARNKESRESKVSDEAILARF